MKKPARADHGVRRSQARELVNNRNFDLMYERQRSPDPLLMDMLWNSVQDVVESSSSSTKPVHSHLWVVDQLRTIPGREGRCELAKEVQRIIMENALMLPTLSEPILYLVSDEVRDFELMSEGRFCFVHKCGEGAAGLPSIWMSYR